MKLKTSRLAIALAIIVLILTGAVAAILLSSNHADKADKSKESETDSEDSAFSGEMSTACIEGTDINISYRLLDDDEFESYATGSNMLGDPFSSYTNYLVSFSEDISSVVLCELTSEINEEGELSVYENLGVDAVNEIKANDFIIVCAGDIGETVPLSGIRVYDNDSNEYYFYIQISGEDGSAILTQYDYSFLNIEGNDIFDESRVAAHLSGFSSIDEALAYFDEQDYIPSWKVLWVVIDTIDADGADSEGNTVHQYVTMNKEEEDFYLNDMSKQFASSVYELSDQSVSIDIDTLLYTTPIEYIDAEYNCIMPDSFDEDTIEKFKEYNSVICTVRLNEDGDNVLPVDWVGLAWGIQSKRYGFCEVMVDNLYEENRYSDYPHHAEGWIHEWIHTLEPVGLIFNTTIASADGAGDHGYPCEDNGLGINGFYNYYADILTANVKNDTGENEGFTRGMWRTMSAVYENTKGQTTTY